MKVRIESIEVEVFEPLPGFRVVSALAHPIIFEDGGEIPPNLEVARLIKASLKEEIVYNEAEAVFVESIPTSDPDTSAILQRFAEDNPGIYVISSILSVEAYRHILPGLPRVVISPITTLGTARVAPELKKCYRNKWAC